VTVRKAGTVQSSLVVKKKIDAQGNPFAVIGGVFSNPSLSGRGLASKVLARALKQLQAANAIAYVQLFVDPGNTIALKLYRKNGFVVHQTVNHKQFTMYEMRKTFIARK